MTHCQAMMAILEMMYQFRNILLLLFIHFWKHIEFEFSKEI